MCRLCIVFSVGCVVVVSLLISASIVCEGYILSWAVILVLFLHCLLLPHCMLSVCIVLGGDCVVVVTLFIGAPIVYVGCEFS